MGPKYKSGKKSWISETIKSSASADLLIRKKEPEYPEDYLDLSNEVDRDTLAENSGSHSGDEPDVASLASVPRTVRERSGSETSSKGHGNLEEDTRPIESDEDGEFAEDHILNPPELDGLDPTSLEQRVRNSLHSNHRFLVSRFRMDEVIELIKAHIRKPNKLYQPEWVENKFIKIQKIWNQIEKLLQALSNNRVLDDSEKRLLSLTNGHLITLRLILSNQFNDGIDEDCLKNGGYTNTTTYTIMMHRITKQNMACRIDKSTLKVSS